MRKLILLFLCLFTHGWLHAQCPPGQVEMGLTVNMGGFPTEHYWKLKNDWFVNGQYFSTTIDSTVAFTYTSMNTTYGPNSFPQHKQCLYEDTLYRFEAWDTFGDGWNGGTYSWERLCDGQVRADNGGMSPGNLSCWVTPCIQAWEYFSPDQCTQHNLWVSQVIESDTALCEGYVYVDVELSNLGVVPADSFLVNVELGPDTQSILVTTPLNFSQSTTITLGPFVPVGSTGGNTYTPKAWTTYPPDTINNNDTLTGNPVTSFANSPFVQTDVQLPPLPPDTNGTVTTGLFYCDSNYTVLTSCYRLAQVNIDTLPGPYLDSIKITLISPSGTELVLMDSVYAPSTPDIYNLQFTQTATNTVQAQLGGILPGAYLPKEPPGLLKFLGEDPNGEWRLKIESFATTNGFFEGIQQWGLSFEVDTPPQLAPDTVVCNNVLLVNGPPGYHTYQWSDGSSGPLAVIDTSGTYTVTTTDFFGCTGTDSIAVSFLDTVLVGQVMTNGNMPLANSLVLLLEYDPGPSQYVLADSMITDTAGRFTQHINTGPYWLRAIPDTSQYPGEIPTYYSFNVLFDQAQYLQGSATCDTVVANFNTLKLINPGGPGSISGTLTSCLGWITRNTHAPSGDLFDEWFRRTGGYTRTDSNGNFLFDNLNYGTYYFWLDIPGMANALAPAVVVSREHWIIEDIQLCRDNNILFIHDYNTGQESLEGSVNDNIFLYPNPASDQLVVEQKTPDLTQIDIRNPLGQSLITIAQPALKETIDVSGLSSGTYLVYLSGKDVQHTRLLIIH